MSRRGAVAAFARAIGVDPKAARHALRKAGQRSPYVMDQALADIIAAIDEKRRARDNKRGVES